MRPLLVIGYIVFFAFLTFSNGWAQQLVSSSGDEFSNADLKQAWSLGELVIDTDITDAMILTQGFHQPDYKNMPEKESAIKVYPNPYDMFLVLEISELESENMFCMMVDMGGKVIRIITNLKAYNEIVTADMSDGIYLLHIYDSNGRLVKSIKIVKLYQL